VEVMSPRPWRRGRRGAGIALAMALAVGAGIAACVRCFGGVGAHAAYVACSNTKPAAMPASRRQHLAIASLVTGPALFGDVSDVQAEAAPSVTPAISIANGGDTITLNNGLKFPKTSFGLQIYDDGTAQRLTETSLAVGYRNFFASVLAGNQKGFARGVKASGIPREQIFICGTVLSNRARGFDSAYAATKRGCDENLKAFAEGGITYVDMIMLDYPGPDCDSIKGQWKAFEDMLAAGTTKSLAVSNFSPDQLDCILKDAKATVPTVNQLPISVSRPDALAIQENKKRGVAVQAWAPLGGSTGGISGRLRKVCKNIGAVYGKSWQQVALRWIVDQGATFSTQTKTKEHFIEDLNIYDFQLTADDLAKISEAQTKG